MMTTLMTQTVHSHEHGHELDKEMWKDVLDHFLKQKLEEREARYSKSDGLCELDGVKPNAALGINLYSGHHVNQEQFLEKDSGTVQQVPQGLEHLVPHQAPPRHISQRIARRLKEIADQFERERAVSPRNSPSTENNHSRLISGRPALESEQDMEDKIIESIGSMDGPVEISALVNALDRVVSRRTLEASLDYITTHVDGVQRVALAFDLVAAICASKLVTDNFRRVTDIATNYLFTRHVFPTEDELNSVLEPENGSRNN